jgi:hypothetical protein
VDRIELRAGFEPTQIGPDFVLGIRTDADGVTSVESYVLTGEHDFVTVTDGA